MSALVVSAICSLIMCWLYIGAAREFRQLQQQANNIQGRRMALQSLLADAIEYSKQNPAIDSLLESVGAKTKAGTSTPPAAKPGK
jgi:hypothetical protein